MAKHKIEFNWEYEKVEDIGIIFRPYVPIALNTQEKGWKTFDFIVDTGADVTMLPNHMSDILGINLADLEQDEFTGIGGNKVVSWKTDIWIKINGWKFKVPAAFTSDNLTPLLLGRMGTLDAKFTWIFDHRKRKIIFHR